MYLCLPLANIRGERMGWRPEEQLWNFLAGQTGDIAEQLWGSQGYAGWIGHTGIA